MTSRASSTSIASRRRRLAAIAALLLLGSPLSASGQGPAREPPPAGPRLTKAPRVRDFVEAPYPEGETGDAVVVLSVAIAASGIVDDARVVESGGPRFDAAAVLAVKRFVFEPAEIDGKPSPIRILYRYAFTLRHEVKATATFEGTVRDRASGKPLARVEVTVVDGETARSATTDAAGHFRIDDVGPGKHTVSLSRSGPETEALTTLRTEETFEAGKRLEAAYEVVVPPPAAAGADADDLELVVVAPTLDKRVVATEVAAEEGRRVPGTQGDVLKVVESMPGVARSSVGTGQLVVWGAAPDDTRVFVDGVRVPRLYHGGGVRSVVATDLVDAVELAPGGWGAAWGRGLGGLVSVRTRRLEDDPDRIRASASIDPIDAGAAIRAPLGKRLRVAAAARRSHLHSTIAPFADDATEDLFPIPRYEDAQLRASLALSEQERLDVTGLHSSDRIERVAPSSDPALDRREGRQLGFQRLYLRYERRTGTGDAKQRGNAVVSVVPWIGLDRDRLTNRFGAIPTSRTTTATVGGLRASWQGRVAPALAVGVGLDAEVAASEIARSGSITNPAREGDARVFGQPPTDRLNADRWYVTTLGVAPWIELDGAAFRDRLHVVPGFRFDPTVSSVSRKTPIEGETPSVGAFQKAPALEPRLAVRFRADDRLSLRAAYGRYHQSAAPEDLSAVFGNPLLPPAAAHHFVAGDSVRLGDAASIETTAFYVLSEDLAMRSPSPAPRLAEALLPIGEGRSFGAQFLLRRDLGKKVSGWVSYTLSRSERRDEPGRAFRRSDYDQPHVLIAVASWAIGAGFEVGARFRVATGFPRTPVVSRLYDARRDLYQPVFGAKNTDRIPAFVQLDVRVAKRWQTSAGELEAYLEVQNVTNRANPEELLYTHDYRRKETISGLPLLPLLGVRWSL